MTLNPERLMKGVHVCALVSTYGDGAMYAGKIWLDSSCGPFDRNLTSLVADGITIGGQYLVQVSWDLDQTIYGNGTDLSIAIRDSETLEPLKQVTYDFSYKGLSELGGFQDKYVEDFSSPQVLRTGIRNPCEMHLTIQIDKVGDQSFLKTDPQEIEKDGNTSSVFIQFRTFPDNELVGCDGNNIKLLFNGYDLEGNRVPSEKS